MSHTEKNSESGPPVICIMGPTASGKTGLAVDLVQQFPLEIISVDSALVYRGMDIGTAKPDAKTLQLAPHRLIDICDPADAYSAARFCDDARQEIEAIRNRGNIPLLVGGTMLYFRALLEGLSEMPAADPGIRRQIEQEAATAGWPAMHRQLAEVDPDAARRISLNDPQRISRALEVYRITGTAISVLQGRGKSVSAFTALKIIVAPEHRSVLHQRIERRFDLMLAAGFKQEMQTLYQRPDLHSGLPSMRAVGYRQGWAWLEGTFDEAEWRERSIIATRQLAKRQFTWLRREKQALWYDLAQEGCGEDIFSVVQEFLNQRGESGLLSGRQKR